MFEFFIALFGGLFYGNKYSNEKSKLKAYDERRAIHEATYNDVQSRYVASYETERWAKDFVSSGEHYDEICSWFAEEFRYVLGKDWKEKLRIPTKFLPMSCIYGKQYPWSMPSAHIMWVYHLLLAKQGKIDHGVPGFGYPIGGINDKDTSIKFAECIEGQLLNAGVRGVRLALELDYICSTKRRTSSDLCGGSIKIESLCHHPTHRLWADYIQK